MLETPLRQAATVLLDSAIRIAPPEAREWGEALRGEMNYVEGSWAATRWALGGASVMAKQALVSFLIGGPQPGVAPGDELFAKHVSLHEVALAAGAGCILAGLLFFASPPFRQAFQVALRPWTFLFVTGDFQPRFEALARRAEARHDAEGLAFCAVRLRNPRQSARLAEESVQLDPNLLWIYAVVALRHPEVTEVGQWVEKLQRGDPQNALLPLITAEAIERAHLRPGRWQPPTEEQQQAFESAMAAAFESLRYDDYLDRVAELNRKVVPRYGFYDPYEVQSRDELDLPPWAFENSARFAKSLLHSGADLEARGNPKGARDKYWAVARYGQVIDSQGRTAFEHWAGTTLQAMAYKQLHTSFEKGGQQSEAALFGYLAAKFAAVSGEPAGFPGGSAFGPSIATRNAAVVAISGLMSLVFSVLVVVAVSILIVGSRRNARRVAQRARPVATLIVLSSAAGLLFSSVTLYLTYRPYWYIFQTAVLNGGRSQARDLRDFLMATQMLPGVPPRVLLNALLYSGSPSFLFYVWTGVTLLGVIGLAVILLRHLGEHGPATKVQPHSRVP